MEGRRSSQKKTALESRLGAERRLYHLKLRQLSASEADPTNNQGLREFLDLVNRNYARGGGKENMWDMKPLDVRQSSKANIRDMPRTFHAVWCDENIPDVANGFPILIYGTRHLNPKHQGLDPGFQFTFWSMLTYKDGTTYVYEGTSVLRVSSSIHVFHDYAFHPAYVTFICSKYKNETSLDEAWRELHNVVDSFAKEIAETCSEMRKGKNFFIPFNPGFHTFISSKFEPIPNCRELEESAVPGQAVQGRFACFELETRLVHGKLPVKTMRTAVTWRKPQHVDTTAKTAHQSQFHPSKIEEATFSTTNIESPGINFAEPIDLDSTTSTECSAFSSQAPKFEGPESKNQEKATDPQKPAQEKEREPEVGGKRNTGPKPILDRSLAIKQEMRDDVMQLGEMEALSPDSIIGVQTDKGVTEESSRRKLAANFTIAEPLYEITPSKDPLQRVKQSNILVGDRIFFLESENSAKNAHINALNMSSRLVIPSQKLGDTRPESTENLKPDIHHQQQIKSSQLTSDWKIPGQSLTTQTANKNVLPSRDFKSDSRRKNEMGKVLKSDPPQSSTTQVHQTKNNSAAHVVLPKQSQGKNSEKPFQSGPAQNPKHTTKEMTVFSGGELGASTVNFLDINIKQTMIGTNTSLVKNPSKTLDAQHPAETFLVDKQNQNIDFTGIIHNIEGPPATTRVKPRLRMPLLPSESDASSMDEGEIRKKLPSFLTHPHSQAKKVKDPRSASASLPLKYELPQETGVIRDSSDWDLREKNVAESPDWAPRRSRITNSPRESKSQVMGDLNTLHWSPMVSNQVRERPDCLALKAANNPDLGPEKDEVPVNSWTDSTPQKRAEIENSNWAERNAVDKTSAISWASRTEKAIDRATHRTPGKTEFARNSWAPKRKAVLDPTLRPRELFPNGIKGRDGSQEVQLPTSGSRVRSLPTCNERDHPPRASESRDGRPMKRNRIQMNRETSRSLHGAPKNEDHYNYRPAPQRNRGNGDKSNLFRGHARRYRPNLDRGNRGKSEDNSAEFGGGGDGSADRNSVGRRD